MSHDKGNKKGSKLMLSSALTPKICHYGANVIPFRASSAQAYRS